MVLSLKLTSDEAIYLINTFLAHKSEDDIAEMIGVSKSYLQKIKKSCIVKMWIDLKKFCEEDDMQSLVAMGHLTGQGLGLASAGVSRGSNVISGGSNIVSGGVSRISNMMNKGKTLTPEQKSIVQESIKQHNPRKAWEQTKDFINQNSKGRYGSSSSNSSMNNGFNNFNNMRFNTVRNQYMNNKDNVSDRKWY